MTRAALLLATTAGCAIPPPFHTLETAKVLPAGGVSVMAGAGGGTIEKGASNTGTMSAVSWGGEMSGAIARTRVGIGHDQEVGLDVDLMPFTNGRTWGWKLAYKTALSPGVALIAGVGARLGTCGACENRGGVDVGLIGSTQLTPSLALYSAARVSGALPIKSDVYEGGGLGETLTVPIGLAQDLGPHWTGMLEIGGLAQVNEGRFGDPKSFSPPPAVTSNTSVAAYGALAIRWQH